MIAPTASIASPTEPDKVNALWSKLCEIWRDRKAALAALIIAEEGLPWWVKSGPAKIDRSGKKYGTEWGWPAIQDLKHSRELSGEYHRPSPATIQLKFETTVRQGVIQYGDENRSRLRAKARVEFRQDMRALVARMRQKRAIELAAGIPELTSREEALFDEQWDIGDQMLEMPPSLNALAAGLLIKAKRECAGACSTTSNDEILHFTAFALACCVSGLTGLIREQVDFLLSRPDIAWDNMPFDS